MKIAFLDGHTLQASDHMLDALRAFGDLTVYDRTAPSETLLRAAEAEVLIVNKTILTRQIIEQLPKLRLICVAGTGFDKVDAIAAREHGVTVCNCAGYSTQAVAQMALSLLLEAVDHVGFYTNENLDGAWCRSKDFCYVSRPRFDLPGKRLAVVGFGSIGQALANCVRPLGVKLLAVTSKEQNELPSDVEKISMDEAFATCDIVSLNCPLNEQNRAFVNADLLRTARKGQILINTARGGLIEEQAVANALNDGTLGAYCADVLTQEPPTDTCPILHTKNVYLTPHIGWKTPQTVERIISLLAENIKGFLNGTPVSVVN